MRPRPACPRPAPGPAPASPRPGRRGQACPAVGSQAGGWISARALHCGSPGRSGRGPARPPGFLLAGPACGRLPSAAQQASGCLAPASSSLCCPEAPPGGHHFGGLLHPCQMPPLPASRAYSGFPRPLLGHLGRGGHVQAGPQGDHSVKWVQPPPGRRAPLQSFQTGGSQASGEPAPRKDVSRLGSWTVLEGWNHHFCTRWTPQPGSRPQTTGALDLGDPSPEVGG